MQLILASTSRYRRELLERIGAPFESHAPAVDEDALKDDALSPRALAEMLAAAKARSLVERFQSATIIGCDQLAACEGRILGKPGSPERAIEQLTFLSGKTHELITAVHLCSVGQELRHTDVTRLAMRRLSRAAIERYVAADSPLDCAGSYALERRGVTLFESIESADHTAITGLPLIAVISLLRELGWEIP